MATSDSAGPVASPLEPTPGVRDRFVSREEEFRVWVEQHSHQLFRLAFRLTGNETDAEDVVQESLLRAYRRLDRFEGRAELGTWIYRIAANVAYDLLRLRQQRGWPASGPAADADGMGEDPVNALPDPGPDPLRQLAAAEVRARIARGLDQLTPRERLAFVLRHFEGLPIVEISRVLGSRSGTTKNSIFRAVRKIRKELAPLLESGTARTATAARRQP